VISLSERKRLFDDLWLLTLCAIFLAAALPWFLRLAELDFAFVAWSVFACAAILHLVSVATDRLSAPRSLSAALGFVQLAGLLILGVLWHRAGGLQNPVFLLAFALPVIGAGLLSRWQPYATALLAALIVGAVAFVEAPELRWYADQIGLRAGWLQSLGEPSAPPAGLFPGFYAPPNYFVALLVLFVVLLLGIAVMSEAIASLLLRLYEKLGRSVGALDEAHSLGAQILQEAPLPTALLFADTFRIVQASRSFTAHLATSAGAVVGRNLFDVVRFSYPEMVEAAIARAGGEAPICTHRVGDAMHLVRARASPLVQGGTVFACLSLEPVDEIASLRAALDAAAPAILVIDAGGGIACFNESAGELFAGLRPGASARRLLSNDGLPADWWQPGTRGRRKQRLALSKGSFEAASVAVPIAGEREPFVVLTLQPAEDPA